MAAGLISLPMWIALGARESRRWVDTQMVNRLAQRPGWAWWTVVVLALAMGIAHDPNLPNAVPHHVLTGVLIGLITALARCDLMCRLLPDVLTLSLLGLGLLASLILGHVHPLHSVIGALFGYGVLWCLGRGFHWFRGVEAIGRGDFAMAAGVGACLGWHGLPLALMVASLGALLATLLLRLVPRRPASTPHLSTQADVTFLRQEVAFGPALGAGLLIGWALLG